MSIRSLLAALFIAGLLLLSLLSPLLPISDPYEINLDAISQAPSLSHLFGTDSKGRDIFSRVIYAIKWSIFIAIFSALLSCLIGFCIGLVAGYAGGRVDAILMGLTDFVMSFPSILLASAVALVLPEGNVSALLALATVNWTSFARLTRGQVLSIKVMPYIEASKSIGCSHLRIILLHVAPVCIPLSLIMVGIKLSGFTLAEATLSFLGLSAQPPTPSLGNMVSANRAYILSAPWMVLFPALVISIIALCFNIIGEALKTRYELKDS